MENNWLRDKLTNIEVTLAAQHVTLQEHVRRSELNEEAVALLRAEIKPLAAHVALVGALTKVVGLIGVLVGIATGIVKLLRF